MNGYLLIGRCGMDDAPLMLSDNMKTLQDYANTLTAETAVEECRRVMDVDSSYCLSLGVIQFVDGKPSEVNFLHSFVED